MIVPMARLPLPKVTWIHSYMMMSQKEEWVMPFVAVVEGTGGKRHHETTIAIGAKSTTSPQVAVSMVF